MSSDYKEDVMANRCWDEAALKPTSAYRGVHVGPKGPADPIELPEGMWQRIAQKAYELYEQRKPSRWGEIHEARE